MTIGGLVTTLRSIVTKSGSKMAFVGLEDKTGDGEVIVFPKLYEQLGDNLRADVVVKVTGKISARDREGNMGDEAKMIADEISIVTDKELADYESHGRKMTAPTGPGAVTSFRKRSTKRPGAMSAKMPEAIPPPELQLKTVYVHVANPNDHATLLALKKACSLYPGQNDIIMVLGTDKGNAIRLPFRVDAEHELLERLNELLGPDKVVVK